MLKTKNTQIFHVEKRKVVMWKSDVKKTDTDVAFTRKTM